MSGVPDYMPRFKVGDHVQSHIPIRSEPILVTPQRYVKVIALRAMASLMAGQGGSVTYQAAANLLVADYSGQFGEDGYRAMAPVLDLLSVDCERKGEPCLAALVVRQDTGLPGAGYWTGLPEPQHTQWILDEQAACHAHWGALVEVG